MGFLKSGRLGLPMKNVTVPFTISCGKLRYALIKYTKKKVLQLFAVADLA